MGRGARFSPPLAGLAASGAPSIVKTWPLPVSATKPMPERVPVPPVQLTVHSMVYLLFGAWFFSHGMARRNKNLVLILLQCNKTRAKLPPSAAFSGWKRQMARSPVFGTCPAPIVSSISSKDGLAPGLTAWGFFLAELASLASLLGASPPHQKPPPSQGGPPPPPGGAPTCPAMTQHLTPADYLKKILTARVYDVAVESALEPAKNLSRRLHNKVLLKREDQQPVFSFKLRGAYNKMA